MSEQGTLISLSLKKKSEWKHPGDEPCQQRKESILDCLFMEWEPIA